MKPVQIIPVTGVTVNISLFKDFPNGASGEEPTANAGDLRDASSVLGLGRSPGQKKRQTTQYSCLETPYGQRSLAGYSPWGRRVG